MWLWALNWRSPVWCSVSDSMSIPRALLGGRQWNELWKWNRIIIEIKTRRFFVWVIFRIERNFLSVNAPANAFQNRIFHCRAFELFSWNRLVKNVIHNIGVACCNLQDLVLKTVPRRTDINKTNRAPQPDRSMVLESSRCLNGKQQNSQSHSRTDTLPVWNYEIYFGKSFTVYGLPHASGMCFECVSIYASVSMRLKSSFERPAQRYFNNDTQLISVTL